MKIISSIILFCLSISTIAQIKTVSVSDLKLSKVADFEYKQLINLDSKDTTKVVYISWRNKEYSHIVDISSILFNLDKDPELLKRFVDDLKSANKHIEKGEELSWIRKEYVITLPLDENNKYVWLYEPKSEGGGYTSFNKKEIEKTIAWFEQNGF